MSDAFWFASLESRLFTIFKRLVTDMVGNEYTPHFGMESESNTNAEFPNFYFHELPSPERGGDLQNDAIHAVFENIEVQVETNTSRYDCKLLSGYAMQALKQMRFEIHMSTDLGQSGNVYRSVIRCRRIIGSEDSLWTETTSSLLFPADSLDPETDLHPRSVS
jgi:hypothetical protein